MQIKPLVQALALTLIASAVSLPVQAQFTVLDQAQDAANQQAQAAPAEAPPPPSPCGNRPITIARMAWPSAEILAEIHARILSSQFGCSVEVVPGDLAATGSAMGSSGQPAVAPEMWVTRIPDVWNAAIDAQMVRPAAPTYLETVFETWFVPDYVAALSTEPLSLANLSAALPVLGGGAKLRFISCPPDWACAVTNRNLIAALGIADMVELVEPANRFEMDKLIAEAVSRKEPVLFYYWQPNAVLAQFAFVPLDMGVFDEEAAKCLARLSCPNPAPSAFADDMVVVAVSDWVFAEAPAVAGYFQRSSLPLEDMNRLMAQLSETGASVEAVADRFVAEREDVWRSWVGTVP